MTTSNDVSFEDIAIERRRLADLLEGLSSTQWEAESSCSGWTVRHVVAHLVAGPVNSFASMAGAIARAGGSYHKANDAIAKKLGAQTPHHLTQLLRDHANSAFAPPLLGAAAPMADIVIHGQDICRPLQLELHVADAAVLTALDGAVSKKFAMTSNYRNIEPRRYRANDLDWQWGNKGRIVDGSAMDLACYLWGREVPIIDIDDTSGSTAA